MDARSDVYALGVVLYRVLADRMPFEVANLSWPEAMQRIFESTPSTLSSHNPELAGPFEHVVTRAMARDVDARYQTAAELAGDLERCLDGRSLASARAFSAPADGAVPVTEPVKPEWSAHIDGVRALAADPAGRCVAAGLASGAIELREARTGALIESLPVNHGAIVALTVTVDGRAVAACGDGTVVCVAFARARG